MALLIALTLLARMAQADAGELRVVAMDAMGAVVPGATVSIESDVSQTRRSLVTDDSGLATATRLPFGSYRVTVASPGFTPSQTLVEIRSAVPAVHHVALTVAPVTVDFEVRPWLVDPWQTGTLRRLGDEMVQRRPAPLPGRGMPELINTQPGWLLEANGIVHPRGSENQTQYVVDGLPLTDNRSPGFAPEIDADSVHALNILTGGYPAEYGRKLGGVVEVATVVDARRGFHGEASAGGGSFGTAAGGASMGYAGSRGSIAGSGGASTTERYLDPPVEENFTNEGTTSHAGAHVESGGVGLIVSHAEARFMVPNEAIQQAAGQLQRRSSDETAVKLSYQRVLPSSVVVSANGMVRDLDADLTSNDAATPIFAEQQRGIRDGYFKAAAAWHRGAHEWKVGGDTSFGRVDEQFAYRITDRDAFDDEIAPSFDFAGRATDREHALFVQDQIISGQWTIKAGLRWDSYHLVVHESAFSPRVAVAWLPHNAFVVRASYDRAFQTPAVENLLLASSPEVDAIAPSVVRLPVRPSRGHFTEVAASASLFHAARLDVSWFDRRMDEFADDDLLLNTGVSFPVAFRRGFVHGAEVKLDVPPGRRVSGFLSYTWMRGEAELPATGGLFLGDEQDLGEPGEHVTISQDQRHTLRGRVSAQLGPRAWVAVAGGFDSGLPFEDVGDDDDLDETVSPRVLDQVNFETGRVRPASTFDVSAGWTLLKSDKGRIDLQADIRNITNRLRVINFAGVLSGTALAPPRAYAARLRIAF